MALYRRGEAGDGRGRTRTAIRRRCSSFFAQYGVTTTHFVPSMLAAFVASLTPENADVLQNP